jgi:5'-methylthioadenosine phosphorylase
LTAPTAVIGGSGLYSLFSETDAQRITIETPYGPAKLTFGHLDGRPVVFLPRHGSDHSVAPHLIRYRANIWALASVGVRAIVSTAAVGAISDSHPVGSLALVDQFIDRTHGRSDTFYDQGVVQHLPSADPFSPALRDLARAQLGPDVLPTGTVVVIQGPRFSTRAESHWFAAAGGHLVNMTLVPEVPLASELNIDTVTLAFVTDNDAAVHEALTADTVLARFAAAQPRILAAISSIVSAIPEDYVPRELIDAEHVAAVMARRTT